MPMRQDDILWAAYVTMYIIYSSVTAQLRFLHLQSRLIVAMLVSRFMTFKKGLNKLYKCDATETNQIAQLKVRVSVSKYQKFVDYS